MRRPLTIAVAALATASLAGAGHAGAARMTVEGVYKAAKNGRSANAILRSAFPKTQLVKTKEDRIRVLIASAPQAVVTGQTVLSLIDEGTPVRPVIRLIASHRYQVSRSGGNFIVQDLDQTNTKHALTGPIRFDAGAAATGIRLADPVDQRFRGALRMIAGEGADMGIVNIAGVEKYLYGVLPGEMPEAWGNDAPQALRAGSIALRSRVLTQRKLPSAPYDFTAQDPIYLGLDGERATTTAAVKSTRRITLVRGKLPYPASFTNRSTKIKFFANLGRPKQVALGPAVPIVGAPSGAADRAVKLALTFLGKPYLWGGSVPSTGFDCSGFTFYVFGQQGIKLPRVAEDQARVGLPVPRQLLLPGDTVFFADSSGYIHHMGLYIGDGKFVHSPRTGDVVKISSLSESYYSRQFAGGRRYAP